MGATVMDQVDRLRAALADRYQLDREIGAGGMAHVYLAHDLQHDRDVAIKVLRPELAAALGTERFLREIRIEARLQHPNILPLFESGAADGDLYYVMPYVEGETLKERIRNEKQLPLADALQITREVAEALSYAHAHNVIHRDIKPANILLSGTHALVADFGIAKAISEVDEDGLTGTGIAVGTPEYMSPEQGSGDGGADRRSDIYALGCVLYEMLAGQPPFTGRTAQNILARHRLDQASSLRVVRPGVPPEIEQAVEKALAKVPADRYATAAEFSQALDTPTSPRRAAPREKPPAPRWPRAVVAAAVLLAGVGIWRLAASRADRTDPNKVMVFPLVDRLPERPESGAGEEVAIMIGSGLEHTEPLKWIDGWTWMDSAQRDNSRLLSARSARSLSRRQGARFYIDGSIVGAGDSATVVLRLNDARADSVLIQASASGSRDPTLFPQLGLRAMVQLLPALVNPGTAIEPSALTDRRPAAVADWLQGEREYRRSQFLAALNHFRRAVEADSALALAALRGAEAADWLERGTEAQQLLTLALANVHVLPPKYAQFARGLDAYLSGGADSAVAHLGQALQADSGWSAAWTLLGEVNYHLIPTALPTQPSAEVAFRTAHRFDPAFAPPLHHLAEIALRNGDLRGADEYARQFRRRSADTTYSNSLSFMLACARAGRGRFDWSGAVRQSVSAVVVAAQRLSAAGAYPVCAEEGFRAALGSGGGTEGERWNATLGLQSLLLAQGRRDSAKAVLDSAVGSGLMASMSLYVVDAVAGGGMDTSAAAVIQSLAGPYGSMGTERLWYHGIWAYHVRQVERLDTIVRIMARHALAGPDPDSLLTAALSVRLALLRGDSAGALKSLRRMRPSAPRPDLASGVWQSLASERLLLAELLLARGESAEALSVAGGFDHPQPLIYLMYLPASLAVRHQAVRRLGQADLAERFRQRLVALGRNDLLGRVP